jgi:hypothetical protein
VQSVPYRQLGYEARGLVVLLMRSEEIVQTCCNALAVQFTPSSLFGHAIQIELLRNLVNIMLVGGAAASNDYEGPPVSCPGIMLVSGLHLPGLTPADEANSTGVNQPKDV